MHELSVRRHLLKANLRRASTLERVSTWIHGLDSVEKRERDEDEPCVLRVSRLYKTRESRTVAVGMFRIFNHRFSAIGNQQSAIDDLLHLQFPSAIPLSFVTMRSSAVFVVSAMLVAYAAGGKSS